MIKGRKSISQYLPKALTHLLNGPKGKINKRSHALQRCTTTTPIIVTPKSTSSSINSLRALSSDDDSPYSNENDSTIIANGNIVTDNSPVVTSATIEEVVDKLDDIINFNVSRLSISTNASTKSPPSHSLSPLLPLLEALSVLDLTSTDGDYSYTVQH